ncbi:alpha/beta hydrolase [Jannaschia sp. 2305UL9-9]|uniref:alpha/beta hydrolase n=1 Tax=Jannaschia sp. 2305UL9-9 TaxID=3121638 RepID=UPI0035274C12
MSRSLDFPDIDPETWAFIDRTEAFYPANGQQMSIADQRRVYDRMCRAFHAPTPTTIETTDTMVSGVPVRIYTRGASTATVVYLHGGGFVVGGLHSHDDVCAELCDRSGYRVIAVDYRLAPEHRHPAAFDDCLAVVRSVARSMTTPLVLVGDSAGGCLAACVSARVPEVIAGQILIYAGLGGDRTKGSYVEWARAPMLTTEDLYDYDALRFDGEVPAGDPTAIPLAAPVHGHLPPTVLITASCDPVRDDSRVYRDRIRAAGGKAHWVDETGLVHGYLRARHSVGRAAASFDRIVEALRALGSGRWPYRTDRP